MVAALASAAIVALLVASGIVEGAERATYGPRFIARGPRETRSKIVVVALDSATEEKWQAMPLVFWTGHYAQMLRNARAAGASVVAFDVIPEKSGQRFVESLRASDEFHPDSDFEDAIQDAGGDALIFAETTGLGVRSELRTTRDTGATDAVQPDELPAPQFMAFPEVSGNLAFTDLPVSPDDRVYEAWLRVPASDARAAPLVSFPALIAQKMRAADGAVARNAAVATGTIGDTAIPSIYINYTRRSFPQVSAVALAEGTLTAEQRRLLRGAAVVIGRTTAASADLKWIPGDKSMVAGVQVQAQAAATLIDGHPLRRLPPVGEAAVTLLFGLAIAALIAPRGAGRWTRGTIVRELPFLALLVALAVGLTFTLFARADILFPLVGPLLAMALPYLATLGVRAAEERRQRLYIDRLFGKQLAIGSYLVDYPEAMALGGRDYDAAVLFFDIRDSTGKEENIPPQIVVNWLNDLFRQIVPKVWQSHPGLVYKYTGDGFLAVFGAPVPMEAPAKVAIDAAVAIVQAAQGFHWPDGEPVQVGCAVNYGTIAAGNIGTDDRLEFTVIGNVVNVAAKIEGLNKATATAEATNVVVTEAALRAAGMTPESLPGRLCRVFTTMVGSGQAVSVYCLDVNAPKEH